MPSIGAPGRGPEPAGVLAPLTVTAASRAAMRAIALGVTTENTGAEADSPRPVADLG